MKGLCDDTFGRLVETKSYAMLEVGAYCSRAYHDTLSWVRCTAYMMCRCGNDVIKAAFGVDYLNLVSFGGRTLSRRTLCWSVYVM